jgi:hypothetical protein
MQSTIELTVRVLVNDGEAELLKSVLEDTVNTVLRLTKDQVYANKASVTTSILSGDYS